MIGQIIKLLQTDEFCGVSDRVEIAKGKFEAISDYRKVTKQIKRKWLARHIR